MSYTRGMKIVATLIVLLAILCVVASARAATRVTPLTVINQSHVSALAIARAEKAVAYQVNHQLRRFWNVPPVRFVPSGGDPIYIVGGQGVMGAGGAHFGPGYTLFGAQHTPSAFAATGSGHTHFTVKASSGVYVSWTVALSHEVLEMAVDPTTQRQTYISRASQYPIMVEVCDAVEDDTYRIEGVLVSDFVNPRWFRFSNVDFMNYDFLGRVNHPFQVHQGGYMPDLAARNLAAMSPSTEPGLTDDDFSKLVGRERRRRGLAE